jgi:hypothetical protein
MWRQIERLYFNVLSTGSQLQNASVLFTKNFYIEGEGATVTCFDIPPPRLEWYPYDFWTC